MHFFLKALSACALCGLAACADLDEFGNAQQAWPAAGLYVPVRSFEAASPASLSIWCHAYQGTLSNDGNGCAVVIDNTLVNSGLPCTQVIVAGIASDRRASVKRFLDAVCNGWRP